MNSMDKLYSRKPKQQMLQQTLQQDIDSLSDLQVKLSEMRRNVETRTRTEEISCMLEEISVLKANIRDTGEALALVRENELLVSRDGNLLTTSKRSSIKIPANLPIFDVSDRPTTFDINDFIELFETRMESSVIPIQNWSSILMSTIPANDMPTIYWFRENILLATWEEAKDKMIFHYTAPEVERKFNNIFLSLKMKEGENIRHFADKFLFITKKAKLNIDSALVRDRFLHAIPAHLKNQVIVAATECSSIDELTSLVISVDSIERSMLQFSTPINSFQSTSKQENRTSLSYCKHHGECKHTTEECQFLQKRPQKIGKPLKYLPSAGNGSGSTLQNQKIYPKEQEKSQVKPWRSMTTTNGRPAIAACPIFMHEPEIGKDNSSDTDTIAQPAAYPCASSVSTEKLKYPELISFPIKMNQIDFIGHLDTGSQLTLINKEQAQKLELPIEASTVMMDQAQEGSSLSILGCIKKVPIEFNGLNFIHDLQVVNLNQRFTCLLGLDIFQKMNLYIGGMSINDELPPDYNQVSDDSENIPMEFNSQQELLKKIQIELDNNFATKGKFCSIPNSVISLDTGNYPASWVNQYSVSHSMRPIVDKQVQQWLDEGIITFSLPGCTWNSALLVVKKHSISSETPKYRVCLDPRHINEKLKDDKYPIPLLRDLLDKAHVASIFSSIDLENSYHQFFIKESDQIKTSFTWNNVQYMLRGAPFGLKTLTSCFQRVITQLFWDLSYVITFVDDILVYSITPEEHIKHLKIVIKRLTNSNLTINQKKCKFGYQKIHVLGHYISSDGIQLDKEKASDAINWKRPKSGKDIQSFLGLTNYFREFIPNYAKISHPLDTLRKAFSIEKIWNNEHEKSFNCLKHALANPPLLAFPNPDKQFYVATDASSFSIGATIFQLKSNSDNINNAFIKKNFIKFTSRSLSKSEQNYSVSKRELLAIVFSFKKFENYLIGRRFILLTDHKPLSYILSQKRLGELQSSWIDILLRFNFEIIYIPGPLNIVPDLLSRLNPSTNIIPIAASVLCAQEPQNSSTETDEDILKMAVKLGKTIPSIESRKGILLEYHEIAHEGASKMYIRCIRDNIFWPNLRQDCQNIAQSCIKCLRFTIQKQGFHPQISVKGNLPMDHVALDLLGPLPTGSAGEKYILVLIDLFTRFIFLRALTNKTANGVASTLYCIFCNFGHPRVIQSDNGSEFINETIQELLKLFGSEHRKVVPYHPQGNGVAERAVKVTLDHLRKILNGSNDWPTRLPTAQLQANLRIANPTNSSPFELMFARRLNTMATFSPNNINDVTPKEFENRLQLIQQVVFPSINTRVTNVQRSLNEAWNKRHSLRIFPVGSYVMVKNNAPINKLDLRYLGPFKILKKSKGGSYILCNAAGDILKRRFPPNLLKISKLDHACDSHHVEKIIDSKIVDRKEYFLVRWFGYTAAEDTWEPIESFDDPNIVYNFKVAQSSARE